MARRPRFARAVLVLRRQSSFFCPLILKLVEMSPLFPPKNTKNRKKNKADFNNLRRFSKIFFEKIEVKQVKRRIPKD